MTAKQFLLSKKLSREILFLLFHKKVNRKRIDKEIDAFYQKKEQMMSKMRLRMKKNIVVSLTSFPDRIAEVQYAVYSMLCQSVMPEKIILWLSDSQFPNKDADLPSRLLSLLCDFFEIRWCRDMRSYKKLVPFLSECTGKSVVICDDDIFYRKHTLKYLIEAHKKQHDDVICHIGKRMTFDENGILLPYERWSWCASCQSEKTVLPIGGGTVLYPAPVLEKAQLLGREDLFKKLAFYADDIWFWFSVVSAGFSVTIPKHTYKKMIFVNPEREYGITADFTLAKVNEGKNLNDEQIKNIEAHFGTSIKQIVELEI